MNALESKTEEESKLLLQTKDRIITCVERGAGCSRGDNFRLWATSGRKRVGNVYVRVGERKRIIF